MERIQPVIDWFTNRGGKYCGDKTISHYQDENYESYEEIEHSGNHEVQYRGLQIFVMEDSVDDEKTRVVLQYLLEHSRDDDDDDTSIEDAINELEPLLPEKAEFELGSSIGTDVFLLRDLDNDDLEPNKLDEILTTLTKFAEIAMKRISILYLAPEFKLRSVESEYS